MPKISAREKDMRRWQARRELAYSLYYDRGHSFREVGEKLRPKVSAQRAAVLVGKERERRGES